jgi:hypothetical protein
MNATAHRPPEVSPPARKELLSDRWLLSLFVLAQIAFAASVAVALLIVVTRQPFGLNWPDVQLRRRHRQALLPDVSQY